MKLGRVCTCVVALMRMLVRNLMAVSNPKNIPWCAKDGGVRVGGVVGGHGGRHCRGLKENLNTGGRQPYKEIPRGYVSPCILWSSSSTVARTLATIDNLKRFLDPNFHCSSFSSQLSRMKPKTITFLSNRSQCVGARTHDITRE